MRARTNEKRKGGFSLIEVCVGMCVVGVVCVALYSGLTSGLSSVRLSRENERATQILTEKLDTIRLYPWDKIISGTYIPTTFTKTFDPVVNIGSVDVGSVSQGLTYTGEVEITKAPMTTAYSSNMRQVTVTVTWMSRSQLRRRSMATMVAKDGMQNYIY